MYVQGLSVVKNNLTPESLPLNQCNVTDQNQLFFLYLGSSLKRLLVLKSDKLVQVMITNV